jgi:hypothetical protein
VKSAGSFDSDWRTTWSGRESRYQIVSTALRIAASSGPGDEVPTTVMIEEARQVERSNRDMFL